MQIPLHFFFFRFFSTLTLGVIGFLPQYSRSYVTFPPLDCTSGRHTLRFSTPLVHLPLADICTIGWHSLCDKQRHLPQNIDIFIYLDSRCFDTPEK
ncbi:hypothetical protein BGZ63DRAFT_370020 [Mariannaea sp. PMI_226]|nr:hypothetical protein BGZ63DRAFT_370020 [Mariannaea sp. PMI_226]